MSQFVKHCYNAILSMVICLFSLTCFNPFFPATDTPPASNSLRGTPQGVIRQLVDAYQKKDIYLYRDLFSVDQDFRFYVAPGFSSVHLYKTCEKVDSLCPYILSKGLTCLYYWTYSDEILSHSGLFNPDKTEQVMLTISSINPGDIRYFVNETRETTNVEIVVRNGSLSVDSKTLIGDDGIPYQYHDVVDDIGEQVFYLEKDPQNKSLWVIEKWFDLNSIQ